MLIRVYARVRRPQPGEPLFGGDRRIPPQMPWPEIALIEGDDQDTNGFSVNFWAADGTFAGDTWHRSFEESKDAARSEYGECLGMWHDIPCGVADARSFAIEAIRLEH